MARNKKSVTVNLREKKGQEIVRKLLASADGLIENFKPGTLEKWGMSPEELHKINRKLIIVRVSGLGKQGHQQIGRDLRVLAKQWEAYVL